MSWWQGVLVWLVVFVVTRLVVRRVLLQQYPDDDPGEGG
jgi:hypothetical protein